MGLARLYSRALYGMDAPEVVVEVHVANGLPSFSIVGLLDVEVKESRDRVRSAIQMSGFNFPARRITVNLAPADLPKDSGRYDLPIALGILISSGLITARLNTDEFEFAGELALDGQLRKVNGSLAIAYAARKSLRKFVLPIMNAAEASLVQDIEAYPAETLLTVVNFLTGEQLLSAMHGILSVGDSEVDQLLDFNQVKGQYLAKDALEIAASGKHSLLMIGNPGCGKSMLAERFTTILPRLDSAQAIESASIYSLTYGGFNLSEFGKIPFRQPHHSSSSVALVGGGSRPKPGEISLAHNGVLFLDEIPEFERKVLEVLREPLETKKINIARASLRVEYPADFQLLAAMNPCPCGNSGHPEKMCKCSVEQINRYTGKLSAPFLDRLDLIVEMAHLRPEDIAELSAGDSSLCIRERVLSARKMQVQRQNKLNYALNSTEIEQYCILEPKAQTLLRQVSNKLGLSLRSYYRLLKVSRTVADLDNVEVITAAHIAKCTQYRKLF